MKRDDNRGVFIVRKGGRVLVMRGKEIHEGPGCSSDEGGGMNERRVR